MSSISTVESLLQEKSTLELQNVWNNVWNDKSKFSYRQMREFKLVDKIIILQSAGVDFKDKKVLDIGCGQGEMLNLLKKYFHIEGTGADISIKALKVAQRTNPSIDFIEADQRDLSMLQSGGFDIVLSFGVMEHVSDFGLAISEAHRLLKPGGTLVLIQPHLLSTAVLQKIWLQMRKKWHFGKQYDFSYRQYKKILQVMGFKQICVFTKPPYKDMPICRLLDRFIKKIIPIWGHYLYVIAKK